MNPSGTEMIRVLLVDDHTILREGINALLSGEPDIEVVGEASDGIEALDQVARLEPDVVIMDLVMPRMNGLEATRQIHEKHPTVRVLVLSMYDNDEYVREILQAGASGYVLKRVATDDLVRAIHEVHAGSSFLYPPIAAKLIDYVRTGDWAPRVEVQSLTAREQEVLILIAEGNTNVAIAEQLGLSRKTIESHRSSVMRKLGVHDVTDLVKYALRKGMISLE
jgi:two-component system, NarL family, response regulator NreC